MDMEPFEPKEPASACGPVSKLCQRMINSWDIEYAKEYSAYKALMDPYNATTNPGGIINMGTAVSGLMDDVLMARFQEKQAEYFDVDFRHFRYFQFYGSIPFRQNIAAFVDRFFKPTETINYENILVLNGALVSVDILLSYIANPGEVVLLPTPAYNGYFHTGIERWSVELCPIPMQHNKTTGEFFELNLEMIEAKYAEQVRQGKVVKGFLLNNPHNPLGKVFPKTLVLEIMEFCHKHNLHLIADEIYTTSVYGEAEDNDNMELAEFHSVLELQKYSSLNKNCLHVVWGFSKVFCLTSFRTGFIHTYNEQLKLGLNLQSQFQAPSLPTMNALSRFISDLDWIESHFIPTHNQRLKDAYAKTKECLQRMGLPITRTTAGFFALVNFKSILEPPSRENCEALVRHFYKHKVYLTPYWEMKIPDEDCGWFRVIFSVKSDELELGLKRIQDGVQGWTNGKC